MQQARYFGDALRMLRCRLRFFRREIEARIPADGTSVLPVAHHSLVAIRTDPMDALKRSDKKIVIGGLHTDRTLRHLIPSLSPIVTLGGLFACCRLHAELSEQPLREIPDFIDSDGRKSFVQIAERSRAEHINFYTIVAIGAQMFLRSKAIAPTNITSTDQNVQTTSAAAKTT